MSLSAEQQQKVLDLLAIHVAELAFVSRCAEFLDYIEADCPGLSPGQPFFQQSAFGLRLLAERKPQNRVMLEDAARVYDVLLREVPGDMCPRGSQMFDLTKITALITSLRDMVEPD
jgi:hypothetical protein